MDGWLAVKKGRYEWNGWLVFRSPFYRGRWAVCKEKLVHAHGTTLAEAKALAERMATGWVYGT